MNSQAFLASEHDRTAYALTTAEAAAYLRLAESTLEKYRIYGGGPKYLKYPKAVRYLLEDLQTWRSERRTASTSEV